MKRKFKNVIQITALILTAVILFVGCQNKEQNNSGTNGDYEEYKEISVGDTAPEFNVELLNGETVNLSDYRGKAVFLNFWATWCGPCVQELPDIQKLHETFPDDLVVLLINCAENKNKVDDFIKTNGYTFNVGLDENGDVSAKYPTMGIPYTVVIDGKGIVTSTHIGAGNDMFTVYEEYVKTALGVD